MKEYTFSVSGALGVVGSTMVKILEEYDLPIKHLKLLEGPGFDGVPVQFKGKTLYTELSRPEAFDDVDVALFATQAEISAKVAPEAAKRGAIVIDNSSHYRLDPAVPLIIPEVNPDDVSWHKGIIANPNCTTTGLLVVIKPLYDLSKIKRVVASTYQATSGAGKAGPDELMKQSLAIASGEEPEAPSVFSKQIAFNVIPLIDAPSDGGYSKEELKMLNETHKMMNDNDIKVTSTSVRVPVVNGHSISVNIETERKITVAEAREALSKAPGVKLVDDLSQMQFPTPLDASGISPTLVGRIREDFSIENGLNLFLSSDNVRKGASQNAVQIAKLLIERGEIEKWKASR